MKGTAWIREAWERWKWQFIDRLDVEGEDEGVRNNFKFLSLGDFEGKVSSDSYRTFCKHLLIVGRRGAQVFTCQILVDV